LSFFADSTASGVTRLEAVTKVCESFEDFLSPIGGKTTPEIVELAAG
jgi:hypothetical protein